MPVYNNDMTISLGIIFEIWPFSFIAVTPFVSLGECLETSTQGADIGRSVYTYCLTCSQ